MGCRIYGVTGYVLAQAKRPVERTRGYLGGATVEKTRFMGVRTLGPLGLCAEMLYTLPVELNQLIAKVQAELKQRFRCLYDKAGSIGKRAHGHGHSQSGEA